MKDIYKEIADERARQDKLWGVQDHMPEYWLAILSEEVGEVAKEICELRVSEKSEYHKGLIPLHLRQYREELVQVAAVVVAMLEAHDRNEKRIALNPQ